MSIPQQDKSDLNKQIKEIVEVQQKNSLIESEENLSQSRLRQNGKLSIKLIYNTENESKNLKIKTIATITFILLLVILNNSGGLNPFRTPINCFSDSFFNMTISINKILQTNKSLDNAVLIIGGLLEDITVVVGFMYFCFTFKSWSLLVGLLILYTTRTIMQKLYVMEVPPDMTFRYPGFPSLFVPYLATNDFFFSGHVSLPSIVAYNFNKNGNKGLAIFGVFTALYEAFMMIIVRGHYSIDLYAGFVFSYYAILLAEKICYYLDRSFIGLLNNDEYNDLKEKNSIFNEDGLA